MIARHFPIGRVMTPAELVPDSQAETKPDAPVPILVADPNCRAAFVEALLVEVRALPKTTLTDEHESELCSLLSTYRSWQWMKPDPHVVLRTKKRLDAIDVAVRSHQAGER